MEEKFTHFQAEARQGQEEAVTKALKRARFEKTYSFKWKGNEAHVLFNAKVDETLAQAENNAASIASPWPHLLLYNMWWKAFEKVEHSLMSDRS